MKKESEKIINIFIRYLLLALIALPGFGLFYFFLTPLTQYPVFYIIQLFFDSTIAGSIIYVGQKSILIAGACIAGSAYYLLLVLNLSTPGMKNSVRLKAIIFSFVGFLVINLIRIIILSFMYLGDSFFFDSLHKILWYFGSTILVVGIWFLEVKIFKIEMFPFYSDLKYFYNRSTLKR